MTTIIGFALLVVLVLVQYGVTEQLKRKNRALADDKWHLEEHVRSLQELIKSIEEWPKQLQEENFKLREKCRAIRNSYRKRKGRGEFRQINWPDVGNHL